ncbi:MAG: hypothetical protein AB7F43_08265 [Bacteriovoracia bacterium]
MRKLLLGAMTLAIVASSIGCSKQEFVRNQYAANGSDIGFRYVPAKVDLVMVVDNTGSVNYGFNSISSQLSSFTSQLKNQYWDYHVTKTFVYNPNPSQPMSKVLVHPDYNSPMLPDGFPNLNTDLVSSYYAVNDANQFPILTGSDVYAGSGSIDNTIYNAFTQTQATINANLNFIRNDALLAVVVITNGVDGSMLMPPYDQFSQTNTQAVANNAAMLKRLKTDYGFSDRLLRFYPIAGSQYTQTGCYSGPSLNGQMFFQFLNYLKGIGRDFCDTNSVSNVMSAIAQDLQVQRQFYIFSSIVLDHEPVESSIKVFKNGQEIPQDANNGWTYKGGPQTVYTITGIKETNGTITPFYANRRTGWVISLNGSAQMTGSDAPSVQFEKR